MTVFAGYDWLRLQRKAIMPLSISRYPNCPVRSGHIGCGLAYAVYRVVMRSCDPYPVLRHASRVSFTFAVFPCGTSHVPLLGTSETRYRFGRCGTLLFLAYAGNSTRQPAQSTTRVPLRGGEVFPGIVPCCQTTGFAGARSQKVLPRECTALPYIMHCRKYRTFVNTRCSAFGKNSLPARNKE